MTHDTTAALARLEGVLADQDPADLDWAREAYARLVLSGVKSSPAGGEATRAARDGRPAMGPGVWAEEITRAWAARHPERFVRQRIAEEALWTWHGAAWGAPLLAAVFAFLFALLTLIPAWSPEPLRLGMLLLIPGIGAAGVLLGALFGSLRRRLAWPVATLFTGLTLLAASALGALMSMEWLRQELDPAVPWPWMSAFGFALVAAAAWVWTSRPGRELANEVADPDRWALAAQDRPDDDAWLKRFGVALRDRAVRREREVRRDVADARAHGVEAGVPLVVEFGSPWEYARTLTVDRPLVLRRRALMSVGTALLFAVVSLGAVEGMAAGERSWWWAPLYAGVTLIMAGRAVEAVTDWRAARRG